MVEIVEKSYFFGRTFSSQVRKRLHVSEKHGFAPGKPHLCSASLIDFKRGRAVQCRITNHINLAFVAAFRNTFCDAFRRAVMMSDAAAEDCWSRRCTLARWRGQELCGGRQELIVAANWHQLVARRSLSTDNWCTSDWAAPEDHELSIMHECLLHTASLKRSLGDQINWYRCLTTRTLIYFDFSVTLLLAVWPPSKPHWSQFSQNPWPLSATGIWTEPLKNCEKSSLWGPPIQGIFDKFNKLTNEKHENSPTVSHENKHIFLHKPLICLHIWR